MVSRMVQILGIKQTSMFTAFFSCFRHDVNEAFTLLGCYVAFIGS